MDNQNNFTNIVSANSLTYDMKKNLWLGSNVYTRDILNSITNYTTHETYTIDLKEKPFDFEESNPKAIDVSSRYSLKIAKKLKVTGGPHELWETEHFFKMATPYIPIVIFFLAIPISVFSKKSTIMISVLFMIALSFLYITISNIGKSAGANGIFPPYLAGWSGNILFGFVSYFLFKHFKP